MDKKISLRVAFTKDNPDKLATDNIPEYADWLESKLIEDTSVNKEDYANFFKYFRDNGEKYIGSTIEEFIDKYIETLNL